jgi:hypothetical protein
MKRGLKIANNFLLADVSSANIPTDKWNKWRSDIMEHPWLARRMERPQVPYATPPRESS